MGILLAILAGILSETFLEYSVHRFLGHKFKKNPFYGAHNKHHAVAGYFVPTPRKIRAILLLMIPTLLISSGIIGFGLALAYSLSLGITYFIYELIHRHYHVSPPSTKYGLMMRKHHYFHHFHRSSMNHGVVTPIWDIVFGTYKNPAMVRVPKSFAPVWMVDELTGKVVPELADHFKLVGA